MEILLGEHRFLYLAVVLIAAVLLLWRRSPIIINERASRVIVSLRILAILFLCLSLADISFLDEELREKGRELVFLMDVSESIPPQERRRAWQEVTSLVERRFKEDGKTLDYILFNGKSSSFSASDGEHFSKSRYRELQRAIHGSTGATDVSGAISRALSILEADSSAHVVLLSDGRSTSGGIDALLDRAKAKNVRISTSSLRARSSDELMVESFKLPEKVFILEKFPVEVLIRSSSQGKVRIRLFRDGNQLVNEDFSVSRGLSRWNYESREETVGIHKYSVHVEALTVPDKYKQNNFQVAAVKSETVPRILVVSNSPKKITAFTDALSAAGVKNRVIFENDFPHGMGGLLQYSAIVFHNVAADELRSTQMELLKKYVEDFGGGFMMLGGKRSFGMGGYYDTPVEEILPVKMSPQSYSTSFGMILLLDASSSMRGFPIQWVKRAAKQIIWLMRGRYLGIYYFNNLPAVAVQLQRIGQNRILVEQDIDNIRAAGGTAFAPAMVQACKALDSHGFANKHIILLSDGNPSDQVLVKKLYSSIRLAGIKISTIGIGKRVNNSILKEIALECDGRFYKSREVHRIPEIFEEEVKRIVGPPYIEEVFNPIPQSSTSLVEGYGQNSFPPLLGYVGTTPKERAILDLLSPRKDVVLAHWRFGLGKTAAFTSGVAENDWGASWTNWSELSKFWGRVIKSILRSHVSDFELNVNVEDRVANLTVDGVNAKGEYINGARLELFVEGPDGTRVDGIDLRQTSQGRYGGSFIMKKKGFYDIAVRRVSEGDKIPENVCSGIVALGFSPEYRFKSRDEKFLEHIALYTGGKFVDDLSTLDDFISKERDPGNDGRAWSTWKLFLLLALLLFVAEVTVRRLNLLSQDRRAGGLDGLAGGQAQSYKRIGDQYLQLAKELDRKGDERQAQDYYLKARSFYLKAKHTDQAAKMWERYRFLDKQRLG